MPPRVSSNIYNDNHNKLKSDISNVAINKNLAGNASL